MGRALIVIATAVLGVGVGIYTLDIVRDDPVASFAGASTGGAIALLAAGWALIGAGGAFWLRTSRNCVGPLLVAAGFGWFLLEWINPGAGSALAFTLGLCFYAACPPLVGHAVLAYPAGRIARGLERTAIAVSYVGGIFVLGILPALLSSPSLETCSECPRNLVLFAERGSLAADVRRVGIYLGVGWALVLAVLIVSRLVGPPGAPRRRAWPLASAGAGYFGFVAATFAASHDRGILWNGTLERRLWLGQAAALLCVALAVGSALLRGRRARSTVARLVVGLAQSPPPGGLRDVLADIIGDPDLIIAYALPDSDRLVDADGRPVDVSRAAQTSLVSDGRRVAVLGHAPGLLDDEQLVEEVTGAARLALENERLRAEVRARLEDLRASRARLVAMGDAERRRLERDLHDGAQQRLVALALSLRLLRSQLASDGHRGALRPLEKADAELDSAISELRELASGIFPAVLADAGLAAAVHALAEDARVPIRIGTLPASRQPSEIEIAAYAVVAETARTARGGITVEAEAREGGLVVEVAAQDAGELDLAGVDDRVGALDGRLEVVRGLQGGVTIRAEFPCES
jgi:signal transduction histidine kinase